MKKIFLYLSAFLILTTFSNQALNFTLGYESKNRSPYSLAFASVGVNLLESRIDSWAKIKLCSTESEMQKEAERILKALNFAINNKNFSYFEDQALNKLVYLKEDKNKSIQLIIHSNFINEESYAVLSIINKNTNLSVLEYEKKLKNIHDFKTYYLFSGKLDYLLDKDSQYRLLEIMLKNMKAENREVYSDQNLISITAFSKEIEKYIVSAHSENKKYNIQAALKSDKEEGKTYINIGVPLLLNNY